MKNVDFYQNLHYDFSNYEKDSKLFNLTPAGFDGSGSVQINDFDMLELNAARYVIDHFFKKIQSCNSKHSSYGLKHIVERYLNKETNSGINYISNGTLILAMYSAGFQIMPIKSSTINCRFNLSERSVKQLDNLTKK